jgi:hypothetical protein
MSCEPTTSRRIEGRTGVSGQRDLCPDRLVVVVMVHAPAGRQRRHDQQTAAVALLRRGMVHDWFARRLVAGRYPHVPVMRVQPE